MRNTPTSTSTNLKIGHIRQGSSSQLAWSLRWAALPAAAGGWGEQGLKRGCMGEASMQRREWGTCGASWGQPGCGWAGGAAAGLEWRRWANIESFAGVVVLFVAISSVAFLHRSASGAALPVQSWATNSRIVLPSAPCCALTGCPALHYVVNILCA